MERPFPHPSSTHASTPHPPIHPPMPRRVLVRDWQFVHDAISARSRANMDKSNSGSTRTSRQDHKQALMTQIQPTIAPGQPAFIRRLPEGVEYTHIKTIFMDLPSALSTLLWSTPPPDDRLVAAFKGRTIRAIDRALRREHQAGGPQTIAIRHELVNLCLR